MIGILGKERFLSGNAKLKDGKTTVFFCQNFSCQFPINNIDEFEKILI